MLFCGHIIKLMEIKKMLIFKKFEKGMLSKNFSARELECKCNSNLCAYVFISKRVLLKLEESRSNLGDRPLVISSGFRCQSHNNNVGGVVNSYHTIGHAVDILLPAHVNSLDRFETGLEDIWDTVISYKSDSFCHCSLDITTYD